MANILKLHQQKPLRLGHKKVNKNKLSKLEDEGQLNLFKKKVPKILSMGEELSPFELAFKHDENNAEGARKAYLKAIKKNDRVADAYCNLGIILSQKDEPAKAIDYLTKSLKENPRHFEAHYNLANVYFDQGNFELAKMHFEVAIEIEPSFPKDDDLLDLLE